MARGKKAKIVDVDDLEGTVEGLARDHHEREVAAYEARTGEKVEYYLPVPLTRTPIAAAVAVEDAGPAEPADFNVTFVSAEGEE